MSQDIIADALNKMMNALKARKSSIVVTPYSKLLVNVLEIMKKYGYINYNLEEDKIVVELREIAECKAIKPRYTAQYKDLEKYVRRFLPARNFGYVIVSTSKGLMTHQDAEENKIGGSLLAYFY